MNTGSNLSEAVQFVALGIVIVAFLVIVYLFQ